MKRIFIAGAGLSASTLIEYLLSHADKYDWHISIGDFSEETARSKISETSRASALKFDVFDNKMREDIISQSDLVISMLPAKLHPLMTKTCLKYRKNMVTASYSPETAEVLNKEAKEAGILLLNEIGLDPGIDHMSAKKMIDSIQQQGGKINSFLSYTGGLVAPRYDNNPWNYKFTWNPRNVILAGQGVSKYIYNGQYKYIPYHKLFDRNRRVYVLNYGEFEAYPNRDSLKYRETYNLKDIPTMFRGTLRRPGFCKSWNTLVQLGATDDTYTLENSENMTYREFINTFLKYEKTLTVEQKLEEYLGIDEESILMYRLRWLGLFSGKKIGLKNATPAQILQHLLEEKWRFENHDRDMIVMQHDIAFELNNKEHRHITSLVVEGDDSKHTAMAKTVGYPVAIAAKHILQGNIDVKGACIPVDIQIYEPVLNELEEYGIKFIKEDSSY